MTTYFEITNGKNYNELTSIEKTMIQDRQTALAIAWQDETNEFARLTIEDELMASFNGLIKGMAYRQAEKSFSLDKEEFEGIISLAFVETLVSFDRTLDKPFQPVFITMVRYAILEMYREKGYDLHDTAEKLDQERNIHASKIHISGTDRENDQHYKITTQDEMVNTETTVVTDDILTELFGADDRKKTIIHMTIQGFKRNEIVTSIMEEGKSVDSVAKMINRTVKQFKDHYLNLMQSKLV